MSGSVCFRCAWRRACKPYQLPLKRGFQTTSTSRQKRNSASKEIVQSKTSSESPSQTVSPENIKPYTQEERDKLAKFYTPAQMAAIEAGESAVDPNDLYEQAALREDPFVLPYASDDLSQILPVVDHPQVAPESNIDPKIRLKTKDELAMDLADWLINVPEDSTQVELTKFMDNMRLTVGKEEAERNPPMFLAPDIPNNIPGLRAAMQNAGNKDDVPAHTKRLMRQTGLDLRTIRSLKVKKLVQHRVVNQTRMGKIQSQYNLYVAGNSRGLLGIGEGKSIEPEDSRRQAMFNAIRSMKPIPRYEERTIFGDMKIKMGAVELELMTRPPGSSKTMTIVSYCIRLTRFATIRVRRAMSILDL